MQEVRITLTEVEAAYLREFAEQVGISIEEAALRAVRYVIKELVPLQNILERYCQVSEISQGGEQRWRN